MICVTDVFQWGRGRGPRGAIAADEPLDQYLRGHDVVQVELVLDAPARFVEAARALGWDITAERAGLVVSGQDVDAVARLIRDTDVLVLGLRERRATLEEAFLRSTTASVEAPVAVPAGAMEGAR